MPETSNSDNRKTQDNLPGLIRRSPLMQSLVHAAAQLGNAKSASLFLVDRKQDTLSIAIALGPGARGVQDLRLPLGHGIAGMVAATGQPLIVSDASSDPRHATEIARATGYHPESIACAPIVIDDEIEGVLELLDKQGAPAFTLHDLDMLGTLAMPIAAGIQMITATIQSADSISSPRYHEILPLLEELAIYGDSEIRFAVTTLRDILQYLKVRTSVTGGPA